MFYRSMSPIEQDHIVEAYTFELGKVYEQAIKERTLLLLADIDTDLCEQVAAGLGLPAPKGDPVGEVTLSPTLSQIVLEPGPIAGRQIGIIADGESDLAGIAAVRKAATALGAVVHVIAPVGGVLGHGKTTEIVERTFLTTRSIEFDTVLIAGGTTPSSNIRLVLLLQEAYRHLKPVGAWGSGQDLLVAAGIPADGPGVLLADKVGKPFTDQLVTALGLHRVWDRAADVMASRVAPAVTP